MPILHFPWLMTPGHFGLISLVFPLNSTVYLAHTVTYCGDTFSNAPDQGHFCLNSFINDSSSKRRRYINEKNLHSYLFCGLLYSIKDMPAGYERCPAYSKTLANNLCIIIYVQMFPGSYIGTMPNSILLQEKGVWWAALRPTATERPWSQWQRPGQGLKSSQVVCSLTRSWELFIYSGTLVLWFTNMFSQSVIVFSFFY